MTDLKLIAFDAEDLAVISAHLQDAVLTVGDMTYLPAEKRFAAVVNRFDWAAPDGPGRTGGTPGHRRKRTGLRFERVLSAKVSGLDLKAKRQVLSLLALTFVPGGEEDPAGTIELVFAGGPSVRLGVECLEAEMRDLGATWRARTRPEHPEPKHPESNLAETAAAGRRTKT